MVDRGREREIDPLREGCPMDVRDGEKDHGPRQAGRKRHWARQEAQEEQRRTTRRVGWAGQGEKVINLQPRNDQLWYRSPGTRVECSRCSREVPVCAGRVRGLPGRPKLTRNEYRGSQCEDEQQEPLSHQRKRDEREARGRWLREEREAGPGSE